MDQFPEYTTDVVIMHCSMSRIQVSLGISSAQTSSHLRVSNFHPNLLRIL
jgi:hypothetical protein